jgi:hypothetical protein
MLVENCCAEIRGSVPAHLTGTALAAERLADFDEILGNQNV